MANSIMRQNKDSKGGVYLSGSIFNKNFQISTWGESHGKALGVVIDGCPAGIPLEPMDIQADLDRRKPGANRYATKRQESDLVQILSGVFEGKTTGTPISLVVMNEDQRSKDYSQISGCYRPGHADYTFDKKYGFRDYRGGGRSSGRETLSRVAAGAVAKKILSCLHIEVFAYTYAVGDITIDPARFQKEEIAKNRVCMPDTAAAEKACAYLDEIMGQGDSAGGIIECQITGMPAGIGETVFDKLDASLAKAIFSIGAVKGFEIGSGFQAAKSNGSINNDAFIAHGENIVKKTNNAGGILGGMSDGAPIILRAAFKPTPSIFKPQETVSANGENITLSIKGRHDPIIVPRAVVVVEAMTAITLVDLLFSNMFARIDNIQKFYQGY